MPAPELCFAESYEAIQMMNQVVLIAQGHERIGHTVHFERSLSSSWPPEYDLLHEESAGISGTITTPFYAFKAFDSPDPLHEVRIRDRNGVRTILVTQKSEGFQGGGGNLSLPLLSASATLDQAIDRMRSLDQRAIVVAYTPNEHKLFLNHQIARAYTDNISFVTMRDLGHPVSITEGRPGPVRRMHLFSMEQPSGRNLVRVTTLFESVEGSVAHVTKVCLCSSSNRTHTVFDRSPSLDQTPCLKAPPGHGTYNCF
jgi:hypothetical protein